MAENSSTNGIDDDERQMRQSRARAAVEHYERVAVIAGERDSLIPIALRIWADHGLEHQTSGDESLVWRDVLATLAPIVLSSVLVGVALAAGVVLWLGK